MCLEGQRGDGGRWWRLRQGWRPSTGTVIKAESRNPELTPTTVSPHLPVWTPNKTLPSVWFASVTTAQLPSPGLLPGSPSGPQTVPHLVQSCLRMDEGSSCSLRASRSSQDEPPNLQLELFFQRHPSAPAPTVSSPCICDDTPACSPRRPSHKLFRLTPPC